MSAIIISNRICAHCGGNKWYIWKRKNGWIMYTCIIKKAEKEKRRKRDRSKDKQQPILCRLPLSKEEYSLRINRAHNIRYEIGRNQLKDAYIRSALHGKGLNQSDIPLELVNLKRKQLILNRLWQKNQRCSK